MIGMIVRENSIQKEIDLHIKLSIDKNESLVRIIYLTIPESEEMKMSINNIKIDNLDNFDEILLNELKSERLSIDIIKGIEDITLFNVI